MSRTKPLQLRLLDDRFAVARLAPDSRLPDWIDGEVTCVARAPNELSVMCREDAVPDSVRSSAGWRCFEVAGPLDFAEIGILSSLATTLAEAEVSLFALSTFDTDYLLVQADSLERALAAFSAAGHRIERRDRT